MNKKDFNIVKEGAESLDNQNEPKEQGSQKTLEEIQKEAKIRRAILLNENYEESLKLVNLFLKSLNKQFEYSLDIEDFDLTAIDKIVEIHKTFKEDKKTE